MKIPQTLSTLNVKCRISLAFSLPYTNSFSESLVSCAGFFAAILEMFICRHFHIFFLHSVLFGVCVFLFIFFVFWHMMWSEECTYSRTLILVFLGFCKRQNKYNCKFIFFISNAGKNAYVLHSKLNVLICCVSVSVFILLFGFLKPLAIEPTVKRSNAPLSVHFPIVNL